MAEKLFPDPFLKIKIHHILGSLKYDKFVFVIFQNRGPSKHMKTKGLNTFFYLI